MTYAQLTREDPCPTKRRLQRQRIATALGLVPAEARRVVDYGAGDAEAAVRLAALRPEAEVVAFEPTDVIAGEARARLAGVPRVRLVSGEDELPQDWADALLCLEVLEHLPEAETRRALEVIEATLRPGGLLIVGVPLEIGPAALAKGMFRRHRRPGDFDARLGGILSALVGRAPGGRPVVETQPGRPYHPHHLGFDHRPLERELHARFEFQRRTAVPFVPGLPGFNSELYITALKYGTSS